MKQAKRLRAKGYQPKVQNGRTTYCRTEVVLGSRFGREICGSADELDRATQSGKDFTEGTQRKAPGPVGK
ncbi:MAG: hypothetical protein NVS9B2_09020 [Steroidobacteraceae bacterium]